MGTVRLDFRSMLLVCRYFFPLSLLLVLSLALEQGQACIMPCLGYLKRILHLIRSKYGQKWKSLCAVYALEGMLLKTQEGSREERWLQPVGNVV